MRMPLALACLVTLAACASGSDDEPGAATESAVVDFPDCPQTRSPVPGMTTSVRKSLTAQIRVGTMGTGTAGDVIFLHGFADRFDNHLPLFEAFVAKGLRVITFDYPSHGESCGFSIGTFGFTGLADLAADIAKDARRDNKKPLYLAGWSTGGLLAVRIAQGLERKRFPRLDGLALFAPGVDVKLLSPAISGVSNETLTRNENPPHRGPIRPSSVTEVPVFATELTFNSGLSRDPKEVFPSGLPTLVFTGGQNEDLYANSEGVEKWVNARRATGATITGLKCAGGFHELDNEPEPMGNAVRSAAASFLASTNRSAPGGGGCASF
jgi:alpha-beta hydrolase superfamily lysophospholipase